MSTSSYTFIRRLLPALLLAAPSAVAGETDLAGFAAATLQPFKQDLQAALQAGMASGGPVGAIDVCRVQAPALATAAAAPGVRIGRTSHRVRNPDNAPAPWLEPLLAQYVTGAASTAQLVELGADYYGYVEPIVTQPLCLACHGSELAPEVASALARLYPDDRATGFTAGEFRGLFWVAFNARAAQ
jgi:hypothetical protein